MDNYNYESFPLDMQDADFKGFPDFVKTGDKAPDGELIDANGGSIVRLSDFWKNGPLMIEFGSVS